MLNNNKIKLIIIFLFNIIQISIFSGVPLTIVTSEEAPYQYIENNNIKGISVDILRELLKETGYEKTEIKVYPWARSYRMALSDENTMIFTISRLK